MALIRNLHASFFLAPFLGVVLLLSGCSSSDPTSTTEGSSAPPASSPPVAVSGQVTKGPVIGAEIRVYQLNSDGSRSVQLAGPFYTDSDGHWNGELASGGRGPFEVVSRWGSYSDEATSANIVFEAGDEMSRYDAFGIDAEGYVVNSRGQRLQGDVADLNRPIRQMHGRFIAIQVVYEWMHQLDLAFRLSFRLMG